MSFKYIYFFFILILLSTSSCSTVKDSNGKSSSITTLPNHKQSKHFEDTLSITHLDYSISSDTIPNRDTASITKNIVQATLKVDSLSIIKRFLEDTLAYASFFKNKYGYHDNIPENGEMLNGTALVEQLERLTEINFFNKYEFITDPGVLNKYNFDPHFVPSYSDSVYALRIEMLNIKTPISLIYNSHVKSFIHVYAKRGRHQTARLLGLKEVYFPLFEEVLDKYDMPLELKFLAVVESALNPTAGSHAGAKGLWQFMYTTGKQYGLTSNSLVDDRFDPYKATDAAARHLKDLFAIYGTWELALAAYNSGPGNVNRAIRKAGGIKDYWAIWPFLPRETRGYVPAFIAVNYIFNYAIEHNIYPTHPGILHHEIDSVSVNDLLSFDQISEFLSIDIEDLAFLNPAYKLGIIPSNSKKTYILRLPRNKIGKFLSSENEIYNFKSSKGIEKEKLLVQIKKATERSIHIVRSGENLGLIAKKYRTSVRKLKSWNNMRNSRIYPGQKIIVYPGASKSKKAYSSLKQNKGAKAFIKNTTIKYHTIKRGDTLWDLARRYSSSVSNIKRWNSISNSYRLKLGDRLIVGKKG